MNLSEALDAALPEMPKARLSRKNPPRIDPNLIARDDLVDGEPIVAVYQRSTANLFRFQPSQWQLAQLFDGIRTYEQTAAEFEAQTGIPLTPEQVRTFAENMDESGFWHKTSQEKNMAMSEKLAAQRGRRVRTRSKFNPTHMTFSAWDPDRYLTRLDARIGKYVYSGWFTLFALLLFFFQGLVFVAKWNLLGPDIALYYNFTKKSFTDVLEFWFLFLAIGFLHESAHGLTCKHYGGEVHSMGLMFLYLAPAFYVDVTEAWVATQKLQRLATIIAGIWVEMVLCGLATIVWTNTLPGAWIHDFCYKLILITGVAVIVVNLNPLIKLDGYYFFTEWIGIPDLKERSTGFLSGWCQRYILRMPVEVPIVPRRRVPLFVLYALASGAYSYMLLFFVVRFSYNVLSNWFAEFALLPAAALAFVIFRGRLRTLRSFLLQFYRVKIANRGFRLTTLRIVLVSLFLVVFFAPVLRDRENAYFVLEPKDTRIAHAGVPGKIIAIYVKEGDTVRSGQVMAQIESLAEASSSEAAQTQMASSRQDLYAAELGHSGLGTAVAAEQGAERTMALAREQRTQLSVVSPIDGVVTSDHPQALLNRNVSTGEALLRVEDPSQLVARLFVPAAEMDRVRQGDAVSLQLPFRFRPLHTRLGPLEGEAMPLAPGLVASQQFKGIQLPVFYTSRILLGPAGEGLRPGVGGRAKIFGARRSLASRLVRVISNFFHTHIW